MSEKFGFTSENMSVTIIKIDIALTSWGRIPYHQHLLCSQSCSHQEGSI